MVRVQDSEHPSIVHLESSTKMLVLSANCDTLRAIPSAGNRRPRGTLCEREQDSNAAVDLP